MPNRDGSDADCVLSLSEDEFLFTAQLKSLQMVMGSCLAIHRMELKRNVHPFQQAHFPF